MSENSTTSPKVLILHAYSPLNLGDKLLIDLAIEQVQLALGDFDFRIVCSDAIGFADSKYVQWRSSVDRLVAVAPRRLRMMSTLIFGAHRQISALAEDADLIVAVGGGYLRGGHLTESVKSAGAHLGQVRLAARHGHKVVYLPQSIGPYRGIYLRVMRRYLSKMRHVFVRDDRSVTELAGLQNVSRMPDLAVLKLAQSSPLMLREKDHQPALHDQSILIVRQLRNPRNFYSLLEQAAASNEFEWAVQSSGGANNDEPITQKYSRSKPTPMPEVLAGVSKRIVVSTRLHGALSSLIAGFPAIHLSYERKGWGAFEDLGLERFVLNARDASLTDVKSLMEELRCNQSAYWSQIHQSRSKISVLQKHLTYALRTTVTGK